MNIILKRIAKKSTYTIGRLYINGVRFCDTLEDTDRGLTQKMPVSEIKKKKIYSQTAIPTGTYTISMNTFSPSFGSRSFYRSICKGLVPRILNVPGFDGVLIHVGNTSADSSGCILVGENKKVGCVLNSKSTFSSLYNKMKQAANNGEKITITIE